MCCFTGPVITVCKTRIFARGSDDGRQLVVYETAFAAAADLAMVLPIPVREGSGDDAVDFIDLSALPAFFDRLDEAIAPTHLGAAAGALPGVAPYRAPPLVVHKVGMFHASFVPTVQDFARLDPIFRLAPDVLEALDRGRGLGFVVVKLAKSEGVTRVHPVAFRFPTRDPGRIFFPTVHVHDGALREYAAFDHALYTTDARAPSLAALEIEEAGAEIPRVAGELPRRYEATSWLGGELNHALRGNGTTLIDRGETVYRRPLAGPRTNEDTWIDAGPRPPNREIVAALIRAFESGAELEGLKARTQGAWRWRALDQLRFTFTTLARPDASVGKKLGDLFRERPVEIVAIRPAERGGDSVFFVDVRYGKLRGPYDRTCVQTALCALSREKEITPWTGAFRELLTKKQVTDWAAAAADVSPEDVAWLVAQVPK